MTCRVFFLILILVGINSSLMATSIVGPNPDVQGPGVDPANADFDNDNTCKYIPDGTRLQIVVTRVLIELPDGEKLHLWRLLIIGPDGFPAAGGTLTPHPTKSTIWWFDDAGSGVRGAMEYEVESGTWTFDGKALRVVGGIH